MMTSKQASRDHSSHLKRLGELIAWLQQHSYDGFILPTGDAFLSEYPPEASKRLEWLTGFSGSAGMALILNEPFDGKSVILFVDGRYTLQAGQQVDPTHFQIVNSGDITALAWLAAYKPDALIAYDPWLHSAAQIKNWRKIHRQWQAVAQNPVDDIWQDRPALPSSAIHLHSEEYAGESVKSKIDKLTAQIADKLADAALLAMPDGINWLLNIRGNDCECNPLVLAYALLHKDGHMDLFTNPRSGGEQIAYGDLTIHPMDGFHGVLEKGAEHCKAIMLDPEHIVAAIPEMITALGLSVIEQRDLTLMPKALKNTAEIEGMKAAHRRDGVALTQFLQWLEDSLKQRAITEMEASNKLEEFRRRIAEDKWRGPSFPTISGSGANGAIVHYRADEMSNRAIGKNELYLVDSGAQYADGTTDVTRTIVNGEPSAEMIDRFTRVLKGHIAIATAQFPAGTTGSQLDPLARQFLWEIGCDYDHGTGHGVGAYLCVHEGPQRISKRGGDVPLQAGMIISNEPGYYKTGYYGIRIENLVLVVEVGKTEKGTALLGFETLTLAPIDRRLIDYRLLTPKEAAWLEWYHHKVRDNMEQFGQKPL